MRNFRKFRADRSHRLHLEPLEGRRLLASIVMQSVPGSNVAEVGLVSFGESSAISTQNNTNGKGNAKPSNPGIAISPINPTSQGLLTSEIGGTATFQVVLQSQPAAYVTIALQSSDPSEGQTSVNSLTFTPANWNIPQTVIVTGVQDPHPDGTVDYQIIVNPAISSDPNYGELDPDDVSLSNLDDDSQTT